MPQPRLLRILPTLALLAACADDPTATGREPQPEPGPRVLGLYEFTLTGIGTDQVRTSVAAVPAGPSLTLTPLGAGLVFESMTAANVTHGLRGQDGSRYLTFVYRVRNMTGATLSNVTMIPVMRSNTIAGTPFSAIQLFDGTAASSTIATKFVPTGAVTLTDEGGLRSTGVDVLQVFTEAEIAAITPPAGVTGMFPYGFMVRNPSTPNSRTLPNTSDPNQFAGAMTIAFRYPLQTTASADPYTVSFQLMAVEDTETRMTESIEEGQDSSAVRQIRERAAALGVTTTTVLNGSPAMDAAVTDYPGQRQICSVRTAGAAGSAVTFITSPAAYALIRTYRAGESGNTCGAYFRAGTAQRAAFNMNYNVTLRAMDLYGNLKTTAVDTVRFESLSGPPVTLPAPAALVNGLRTLTLKWSDYGTADLRAVGRRNRGRTSVTVAGITRTWTGDVDTEWTTAGNWVQNSAPGSQDSVFIPALLAFYPLLTSNVAIGGVTVEEGGTMDLGAFDLTVTQNVATGPTTGITSTSGRLILAGTTRTVQGVLPTTRVTGTYTLNGDVESRAGVQMAGGRLRADRFRLRTDSF